MKLGSLQVAAHPPEDRGAVNGRSLPAECRHYTRGPCANHDCAAQPSRPKRDADSSPLVVRHLACDVGMSAGLVTLGLEHANIGEVSVRLRVIETVADDK